ncbi:MAG: hypothetical protein ABI414_07030, partial [Devosia sp.]
MRKRKARYVNGSLLHSALRELRASLSSPRTLTGMAGASLVLAISGPFETLTQFDLPGRLLYWMAIVVLSYLASHTVARLALDALAGKARNVVQRIALATLASSVPAWIVVYGITRIAMGDEPVPPLRLWFYCLVVSGVMATMMMVMRQQGEPLPAAVAPLPEPPAILERLPHPLRGRLLHLSVSDHYVDVVTDKGHDLVLMRLSDAMRDPRVRTGGTRIPRLRAG